MQGKKFSPFRCHMSNEKRAPSYLGYLLGIILHSYLGILMKQPVLQWKVSGQVFLDRGSSQRSISSLTFHALGESIQVGPKPRSLEISNRWTDHCLQKPAISPKLAQGEFFVFRLQIPILFVEKSPNDLPFLGVFLSSDLQVLLLPEGALNNDKVCCKLDDPGA